MIKYLNSQSGYAKLLIIAIIAIAIPVTLFVAKQSAENRSRASDSPVTPPCVGLDCGASGFGQAISINEATSSSSLTLNGPMPIGNTNRDIYGEFWINVSSPSGFTSKSIITTTPLNPVDTCKSKYNLFVATKEVPVPNTPYNVGTAYDLNFDVTNGTGQTSRVATGSVPFSTWTHVAYGVNKDKTSNLYINGQKQAGNPGQITMCNANSTIEVISTSLKDSIVQLDEMLFASKAQRKDNFSVPTAPIAYSRTSPTANVLALFRFNGNLADESVNYYALQPSNMAVTYVPSNISFNASSSPNPSQGLTSPQVTFRSFLCQPNGTVNVRMTWNAIPGAVGYNIYNANQPQLTWLYTAHGNNATDYTITNLPQNSQYKYAITAFSSYDGDGDNETQPQNPPVLFNVPSCTTNVPAPFQINGQKLTNPNGSVSYSLSWPISNPQNLVGYEVYAAPVGGAWQQVSSQRNAFITSIPGGVSILFNSPTIDTTKPYQFYVVACNIACSVPSNTVTINP